MKNFLLAMLLICGLSLVSRANMAAPSQGGNMTGEPNGLENIFIRNERLTIDFRSVADESLVKLINVEAVYEVENTSADKSLTLIFVLGTSEISDFNFYLDEQQIAAQVEKAGDLPASWKVPQSTPWHKDRQLVYYPSVGYQKTARIVLTIPSGAHTLKAQYKASSGKFYGEAPLQLYQFAYILAPARNWAGFGGLDVTVHTPDDWEFVSSPKIEQNGATTTAHFDKIPADALTFTFGKPLPQSYYLLDNVLFWLAILTIILPPFLLGWLFIRQKRKGNVPPAIGFLLCLPYMILVGAMCFAAAYLADYIYPTITYGYGTALMIFVIPVLCIGLYLAGSLIWLVAAYIVNKKQ